MEWVEVTGATIAEATEHALDRLGVDVSDAEIDVLQEPGRAMFGLRKIEARIRARVRPTAPPPRQERNDRRRGGQGRKGQSGQRSGKRSDKNASRGRDSSSGVSRSKGSGNKGSGNKGSGNKGSGNKGSGNKGSGNGGSKVRTRGATTEPRGSAPTTAQGDPAPRTRKRTLSSDGKVRPSTKHEETKQPSQGGGAPAPSSDGPTVRRRRVVSDAPSKSPTADSVSEAASAAGISGGDDAPTKRVRRLPPASDN